MTLCSMTVGFIIACLTFPFVLTSFIICVLDVVFFPSCCCICITLVLAVVVNLVLAVVVSTYLLCIRCGKVSLIVVFCVLCFV
jgi:hypothetical protein